MFDLQSQVMNLFWLSLFWVTKLSVILFHQTMEVKNLLHLWVVLTFTLLFDLTCTANSDFPTLGAVLSVLLSEKGSGWLLCVCALTFLTLRFLLHSEQMLTLQ